MKVLKQWPVIVIIGIIIGVGVWDQTTYQYTDMSVDHMPKSEVSYLEFEMETSFIPDSFELKEFTYRTWCVEGSDEVNASEDFQNFKVDVTERCHTPIGLRDRYQTRVKLLVSDNIGFLKGKRLCESPEYIEIPIVVYGNNKSEKLTLRTDLGNIILL